MGEKYIYSKNPFVEKHMPTFLCVVLSPLWMGFVFALLLLVWTFAIPIFALALGFIVFGNIRGS